MMTLHEYVEFRRNLQILLYQTIENVIYGVEEKKEYWRFGDSFFVRAVIIITMIITALTQFNRSIYASQ